MSSVKYRNVVDLVLFVFSQSVQTETPRRALLETFTVIFALENENELKQGNQSYEDRYKEVEDRYKEVEGDILCNIKKHEPYLDIDYEELQNFDFIQSDEEEDNDEFSMINPNLLDLDLEVSDSVSSTLVVSKIIDNLSLSNEQFYEICSQLNEGHQHLFNFVM